MVRADAEAADHNEVFGMGEDAGGQLGFGTNAENVDFPGDGSVWIGHKMGRMLAAHFIFSMSWSSGNEDFKLSTWYPCCDSISLPI